MLERVEVKHRVLLNSSKLSVVSFLHSVTIDSVRYSYITRREHVCGYQGPLSSFNWITFSVEFDI